MMAALYDLAYRARRVQFAMALVLLATGFVGLVLREDLSFVFGLSRVGGLIAILTSLGYGTALLLLLYLRGALPFQARREEEFLESAYSRSQADRFKSALDRVREQVEALSAASAGMSPADKQQLVDAIRHDISGLLRRICGQQPMILRDVGLRRSS